MSKSWHAHRAAVALDALAVPMDETFTTLCPACNGGASGERKLRVTRAHNGALFVCLRASCGFRGFVAMDSDGVPRDTAPKHKEAKPFRESSVFDYLAATDMMHRYPGFSRTTIPEHLRRWGVRFLDMDRAVRVYECKDMRGVLLGTVVRTPEKQVTTYREREGVDMYAYYAPENGVPDAPTVLVEDSVSAMCCASHGYPSIALLGTNVPASLVSELRGRDVLLFLDPDAFSQALKLGNQHEWPIIAGSKDPKDTHNLEYLLEGSYV